MHQNAKEKQELRPHPKIKDTFHFYKTCYRLRYSDMAAIARFITEDAPTEAIRRYMINLQSDYKAKTERINMKYRGEEIGYLEVDF